jgi:hypothetical protein
MKPCQSCGNANSDGAAFCLYCGANAPDRDAEVSPAPPVMEDSYSLGMVLQGGAEELPVLLTFLNRDQLVDFLAHAFPRNLAGLFIRKGDQKVNQVECDRLLADAAYVEMLLAEAERFKISLPEAMERFSIQPGYTPYEHHENL